MTCVAVLAPQLYNGSMWTVAIQSLVLASSGLLSFGSMTIVILLLLSDRGWSNGLASALGYTGAYMAIGLSVVVTGTQTTANGVGQPGLWLPILLILLGLFLLWLSRRNWRTPASTSAERPRFFSLIDSITLPKAFGIGALVTVVNVKNLALFLSALSVVVLSDLSLDQKILVTVPVVLVFCLAVSIPVTIYLAFPHRSGELLVRLKTALEQHSRPLGIWAPLLFGTIFLTRGLLLLL